jgi:hypothetical protein
LRSTCNSPRSTRMILMIRLSEKSIVTMSNTRTEEFYQSTIRVDEKGAEGEILWKLPGV